MNMTDYWLARHMPLSRKAQRVMVVADCVLFLMLAAVVVGAL